MADVTQLDIDIEASAGKAVEAIKKVSTGLDGAARAVKKFSAAAKNMGLDRSAKSLANVAKVAGATHNLEKVNAQIEKQAENYEKAGNAAIAAMLRQNSNLLETEKRLAAQEKAEKDAAKAKKDAEREKLNATRKALSEASLAERTRHNKAMESIATERNASVDKARTAAAEQRNIANAERHRHNRAMEYLHHEANANKRAADEAKKANDVARNRISTIRETGKAVANVVGSIAEGVGNLKIFSKLFKGIARAASGVASRMGAFFKNVLTFGGGKTLGKLQKFIKAIGRIALYRAIRSMIKAITQGFAEGIKNLYAYSELIGTKFKPSMDMMATAALYVKNAFAAMAAPLINTVAPIIDMIGDKVAALANKMAEFFAALTGQNVYTRAIKYAQEYNDELDETAKKLERWLAPFDEINRMNDNGGSGNGSNIDYSKMFEEAIVSTEMSELARKIIEAFQSADLSPIGAALAEKLKSALDSFDWKEIQKKAAAIASKITSFINGAVSTDGVGRSIGRAIAGALNTAVTFASTLVSTLNWKKVGTAIGESIRTFITEFNFEGTGSGIGDFATGILDALKSAIDSIGKTDEITGMSGWDELGKRIADGIANIRFGEILKGTITVGMSIVNGILDSIIAFLEESEKNGFWDDLGESIGEALASIDWVDLIGKVAKIGVGIVKGIFKSIKSALAKGLGIDDTTAGFIVDALAVGLLAKKVASLFGKTKALTGGFSDKNKQLSQQTALTEAETVAVGDLDSVYQDTSKMFIPGLVGGLVMLVDAIKNVMGNTETAGETISSTMSSTLEGVQASVGETANSFAPLNNIITNTVPNSFKTMGDSIRQHLSTAWKNVKNFVKGTVQGVPNAFKGATDNVAENLEVSAKNEESYLRTEGENWRKYNQTRADQAVQSARDIKKANDALKNGLTIAAATVLAGIAIGQLGGLSRGHGGAMGAELAAFDAYASGGFPAAGSLFIAGEGGASPEYVGSFGGQTGVWNSDQLVNAMYNAFSAALASNQSGGDIYLDGEIIYRNMVRRNNNQVRSTGRTALLT